MKNLFFILSSVILSLLGSTLHAGDLKVTLTPSAANSAGAQWRVDGGFWRKSGNTANNLSHTTHLVEFKSISNWIAPAAMNVAIPSGLTTISAAYVSAAKLKITLTPSTGKWRIDGGTWRSSGTTVSSLTPGNHTISYQAVSGYLTPADETVALTSGQTTTLARSYLRPASLSITLTPANAQWRVDGGAWQNSGATTTNLTPGAHTVDYAGVAGYAAPAAEAVTLTAEQLTTLSRSYTQLASLAVTLAPASAQWRVDGGAWRNSGTTASDLTPGNHTLDYSDVAGYVTPASESVILTAGQTLSLNRGYVQLLASLTLTLSDPSGQWRVDGGAWQASASTVASLLPGNHAIDYSSVFNHQSPPSETVTLTGGQSLSLTRTYTPLATVNVTLNPNVFGAQWRINGGEWMLSGYSVYNLAFGVPHTIEYSAAEGYVAPPSETITLTSGELRSVTGTYTPIAAQTGSLSITLEPTNAQWRVDGGAWQTSGATVNNLTVGQYVVEYHSLSDFIPPAQELVTIAAGTTTQFTRTYTATPADPAFAIIHRFSDAGTIPTALRASDGRIYVAANTGVSNGLGHIFRINQDGTDFQQLKWFGSDPSDGSAPKALIEGSDGVLYGTTLSGPDSTSLISNGRVYRINKDGTGYAVLAIFNETGQGSPNSLLEGADGSLYVTTTSSGSSSGKIYKLNRDGTGFSRLIILFSNLGSNPQGLVQATSGVFYGIARSGGSNNSGSIFKFNPDGTGYTMIKGFAGGADGADPRDTLLVGSDQMLYGTTYLGGVNDRGIVYRINQDGSGYQILRSFAASPDGGRSEYALVEDVTGVLYGTTLGGGASNRGTLFRLNKDGSDYSVVRSFSGTATDGGYPKMKLLSLGNGTFAGATSSGGAAAKGQLFTIKDDGSNFTVILQLGLPAGGYPWSPVSSDGSGVLYGTTYLGGTAGTGTIFRINEDGTGYSVLQSLPGPNGGVKVGALILASNGVLYGTTSTSSSNTLFRINTDGIGFTVLKEFDDGVWSGVTEGSDGNLYGVLYGSIYRIAKDGTGFNTLHTFAGGTTDGTVAHGALVQGTDGRLYGTTNLGGSADAGVIFSLNKDGTGYTILRHFLGGASDGSKPVTEMIQGSDGALYGSTYEGGPANFGTLFKINPDGTGYVVLRIFTGTSSDGALPTLSGLLEKDGFLYGTTVLGGAFNRGTIYRLRKDGSGFEILINFGVTSDDGFVPYSGLIEGSNGRFFGTTNRGGTGAGSIFYLRLD